MSDILERVRKIVIEHLDADPEKVTEKASFIALGYGFLRSAIGWA